MMATRIVNPLAAAALGAALLTAAAAPAAHAATAITEAEAHDIGVQAYVYFYPLVTMELTRRQMTNVAHARGFHAPMNMFANIGAYPAADMRVVVRPNFDTLYSSGWLDLTKEPMVVSAPDTQGRYYMLPMLDMWTDAFASPGWRTTGTTAHDWAVVPPGWRGTLPEGVDRIDAPTPYVWVIGRTKTDGPADYTAVHAIQDGYRVTPLSRWGEPSEPVTGHVDPAIDMKTPPKEQVDTMPAAAYFALAAEVMKLQPPHLTDQPIIARMRRIGIVPGRDYDLAAQPEAVRAALANAPEDGQHLMAWKVRSLARVANHWVMNTDTMGVYGDYYLKRAIIAQFGLGANVPEDAIYPLNIGDADGRPLDGANDYVLHFPAGQVPPASAFWSVTLYDTQGYQVANPINRFAVSSWMDLRKTRDGALDLYIQHVNPGPGKEANWLPAPKGPFTLTMRLYAPKSPALVGEWNPPPVERVLPATIGE